MATASWKAIFSSPDSFGATLLTGYIDLFFESWPDCIQWTPETIEMELEQSVGVEVPALNYDRLMTAVSLLTTNSFFQSPVDFIRCCVVLSGHHVAEGSMILPSCEDLSWGITEALLIRPPDDDDQEPFSKEIVGLIGQTLKDEGILQPVDVLRLAVRSDAPDLLSQVSYDYSDDPQMFEAVMGVERGKTEAIQSLVRARARALFMQVRSLPLQNGDPRAVADRLLARLPGSRSLQLG